MYKKITTIIALIAISGAITFATGLDSDEIEAANNLAEQGIINNHKSNPENYNLTESVLRQEIAAVARGVAKLDKKSKCDNIFGDLSATNPNSWACVNVEVLVDNDLISKNENFRPEDNITKSETLGMLIKAIGFDYEYDTTNEKNWQEQIVDYAVKMDIVDNFTDYNTEATRGWVFEIADITIKKDIEIKIEKGIYSDEAM